MDVEKIVLENGLRIILVPRPSYKSVTLTLWVSVGSRFEGQKKSGITHFLEHMVFKGSVKRPTAQEIYAAVDSFGGEFNATTSKDWTNFYIKAKNTNLAVAFEILTDMVLNPLLRQEDIDKEKDVICEEISMYTDTPRVKVGDLFDKLIFKGHPLAMEITGTKESVRNFRRSDLLAYREKFYRFPLMLLTVAGGVNKQQVLKLCQKYFPKTNTKKSSLIALATLNFKSKQTKPALRLYPKKLDQAHLVLGYLGNKKGHPDRYAEAILSTILGGSTSSRLYLTIRENYGFAYSIRTWVEHYSDTGFLATYAGVDIRKIDEAIKIILEEHHKISNTNKPISEKEITKAKKYLKGHLALALEDTKDINCFFGEEEVILGRVRTPEEVFNKIDKVRSDDLIRVAQKFFKPQRLNLVILGPYNKEERFEKLLPKKI